MLGDLFEKMFNDFLRALWLAICLFFVIGLIIGSVLGWLVR